MDNRTIKLGDIARECRQNWTGSQQGVPVVGLEHLEPGEIELKVWDHDIEHTFSKKFQKGQVLLGRRRVYLRKAVAAPFDGICSGDITVIEALDGIIPELLPFIIQNDRFFDFAMQGSAGSLSPRVKWEHLKNYPFSLPPLSEQKILAEKLWAAYRLKEAYKKLLVATDEMVKAKFVEMFGDPIKNTKMLPSRKGDVLFEFASGKANTKSNLNDNNPYNCYGGNGITGKSDKWLLESPTLVIGRVGEYCGCVHRTTACSWITDNAIYIKAIKEKVYDEDFLFYLMTYLDFHRLADETGQPKITQRPLLLQEYIVPSLVLQQRFVAIAQQAGKSIISLRKSIESIDSVIKSLINNQE